MAFRRSRGRGRGKYRGGKGHHKSGRRIGSYGSSRGGIRL